MTRYIPILVLALYSTGCTPDKPAAVLEAENGLPEVVDYNYHVKPILSDRCFACHGPDDKTREAGLRFDVEEAALARLEESGNYAIVPGNLRKSEVFHRLIAEDPEVKMPPLESNLTMSPEETAVILRWIEQGAEYKPHWSFIPPERAEPPAVSDEVKARNEIDRFVLARLEQEGLEPAEEASRETLIRRLSFDLTGLPPTIEEIDAFLADESPSAYEKLVDRLLDSPHYGERMAADWMDVARYADSHGYQDDGMRNMWPWRDWVIESFNRNQPFDEFLTWQLAGDLLPDATREQILATGFNRNHMQSQEGGIVPEEFRVEYVADRTHTLGTAFMGLTLQCARCHDHKYDPVSQKEYYQLFGFFNSVNEIGVIPYAGEASPTVILPSREAEEKLAALAARIQPLEEKVDVNHADYDAGFEAWLESLGQTAGAPAIQLRGLSGYYPLDGFDDDFEVVNSHEKDAAGSIQGDRERPPNVVEGKFGMALELNGESWFDAGKDRYYFERNQPFSLSVWFKTRSDSAYGPLVGKSHSLFNGNRGYMVVLNEDGALSASLNHVAPDNSIEVRTVERIPAASWHHLTMTYDGSSRAGSIGLYLNGEKMEVETVVDNLQKSILYTYNFYKKEETNWGGYGTLRLGMIGPNQTHTEDIAFDELKIYRSALTPLEVAYLFDGENPFARMADEEWMVEQQAALRAYYVMRENMDYRRTESQLHELRGEVNEIITRQQEVMVMGELDVPRSTYILERGAYDAPTQQVGPGTPEVLPAFAESMPQNRLGLAQWLTDPAHPLTARVTVNRLWQQVFGRGLVATPDDFGSQGEIPSHPELLDWLAVTFVDSAWDVKGMLKQIVMSATYRQSSVASKPVLERDPGNVLLARGPSYRMTAEMIRDNALAVSGLLVRKIGGPSVHPYQPAGLWKELATRNETEYRQDTGDKLYRRSLYTIWKRSTPPPSMINFDAAERSFCQVQRQKTSTPLQALVLLNDPQYVEASRMLAERMLREGGDTIELQIEFAFRLLTSRRPLEHEIDLLTSLFEEEYAGFEADKAEAGRLLEVGDYPVDAALNIADVAARTIVASTIMNFDEAYMKR